jgi:glycosyltransferase involved in cell wall biosynthesis
LERLGAIPVDLPLSRAGMNPFADVVSLWKLIKILRDLRPDISYSYFIKPAIYGSIASAIAGVPRRFALIAGLGHSFATQDGDQRLKQKLLRWSVKCLLVIGFKLCHGVIFQNEDDRTEFTNFGLVSQRKTLRTRGTGVDITKLQFTELPKTPITFLLAARLIRSKGIIEYVKAANIVRKTNPNCRFILLGGVDENPESITRRDIETLVTEYDIEWYGHVNDVQPYIAQSHIFVLPSYYREGIPRSIQEAMAVGRAIITTDNVGCRETVIIGHNGFIVPIKDIDALAKSMSDLSSNIKQVEDFGRESRKLAEIWFDAEKINLEILAFMGIGDSVS